MTSLGSFGTKKPTYDFDYFGTTIRVNPSLGPLTMLKAETVASQLGEDADGEQVEAALKSLIGIIVHPDDLDRTYDLAAEHGQDIEDLTDLIEQVVEAVTNRPTARRSSSSAGQPRTRRKSAAGSSSRVQRDLEKKGRADLAVFPYLVSEDQKSRSA